VISGSNPCSISPEKLIVFRSLIRFISPDT
jgi:hypothetical protein